MNALQAFSVSVCYLNSKLDPSYFSKCNLIVFFKVVFFKMQVLWRGDQTTQSFLQYPDFCQPMFVVKLSNLWHKHFTRMQTQGEKHFGQRLHYFHYISWNRFHVWGLKQEHIWEGNIVKPQQPWCLWKRGNKMRLIQKASATNRNSAW